MTLNNMLFPLSTRLNKKLITNTFLYCNTRGKNFQKNPVLCYIFIDYFCSEQCHIKKTQNKPKNGVLNAYYNKNKLLQI